MFPIPLSTSIRPSNRPAAPSQKEATSPSPPRGLASGPFQWHKDGRPIPGATSAGYRICNVKKTDAGRYSVRGGSRSSVMAILSVTPKSPRPEPYASPVPWTVFSETLAEQEKELKTNELMLRFAASRKRLASITHRPAYHFVSPENMMNDPNGLCFWRGRWHLFYQAYPPDEFPDPKDIEKRRQHWGHAVSEDLVHWRDLPYAIYPGIERMCFSGSTVVEADRPEGACRKRGNRFGPDPGQHVGTGSGD